MAIDFVFLVGIRSRKLCDLTVKVGIQTSCDVKVKCNSAVCNIWTIEILVLVFKLKQILSVFHTPMLYNKFNFIVRRKLLDNGDGNETLYSYDSLPDPRLFCKWKKLTLLLEKNQLCDALVKRVSV